MLNCFFNLRSPVTNNRIHTQIFLRAQTALRREHGDCVVTQSHQVYYSRIWSNNKTLYVALNFLYTTQTIYLYSPYSKIKNKTFSEFFFHLNSHFAVPNALLVSAFAISTTEHEEDK